MKNIPEIRIKGFEGEWKEKQLKDVCEVNPTTSVPDRFEYVDLESVVGTTMVKHRTEEKATAPSRAQRHAKYNDIFFQTVRPYQKNNYLFQKKEDNYVFSTGYAQLRANINPEYLFIILQSTSFVNQVLLNCTGSNYPAINPSALSNIDINITESDAEQQSLGSFFSSFDRLLSDHHRRLENLRRVKKSMLQKMFPQQGQTVPEIRFKGFSGEWKEKQLGEALEIGNGTDYKHLGEGNIPVYGTGGIIKYVDDYLYDGETVCIGRKGTIDSPIYHVGKIWTVDTLFYTYDFKDCNVKFLYYLFCTINWKEHNEATGVPSLSKENIKRIVARFPNLAEQHLIGSFFTSLDNLINDEVNYIDQLTRVKSTLLQKMFV